jgi:hypothetical protein
MIATPEGRVQYRVQRCKGYGAWKRRALSLVGGNWLMSASKLSTSSQAKLLALHCSPPSLSLALQVHDHQLFDCRAQGAGPGSGGVTSLLPRPGCVPGAGGW